METLSKNQIRVGVIGYSAQQFDRTDAIRLIRQVFDSLNPAYSIQIASGLTDLGIPALAYREATRRGWMTVGVACSKAYEYPCYPVDRKIIIGSKWGDESPMFLGMLDVLVRIGGGKQSMKEIATAKRVGIQTIEFDLPATAK